MVGDRNYANQIVRLNIKNAVWILTENLSPNGINDQRARCRIFADMRYRPKCFIKKLTFKTRFYPKIVFRTLGKLIFRFRIELDIQTH